MGWAAWFVRFFFVLSYRPLVQCWAWGGPSLLVCSLFFRPADPPTHYGAMVWVIGPLTEARDGRFCRVRFFCRPADALLSSEPGGGQGNQATHTVAQDCMFRILSFVNTSFCFLIGYAFSARHLPPSRDCGLCHLSISCWFSPFVSSPPPRW